MQTEFQTISMTTTMKMLRLGERYVIHYGKFYGKKTIYFSSVEEVDKFKVSLTSVMWCLLLHLRDCIQVALDLCDK